MDVPDARTCTQRSLWDTVVGMYANLLSKLNQTLVGADRKWLAHLPPVSGALVFAEAVHRYATPVHTQIVNLIDAGDVGLWDVVERAARELVAAVPAPFNAFTASIDLAAYEPEFFHLLARYAHGFIVLINELNATHSE